MKRILIVLVLFLILIMVLVGAKINADKIELSANDVLNLLAGKELNLSSENISIVGSNFSILPDGTITSISETGAKVIISKGAILSYTENGNQGASIGGQNIHLYSHVDGTEFGMLGSSTIGPVLYSNNNYPLGLGFQTIGEDTIRALIVMNYQNDEKIRIYNSGSFGYPVTGANTSHEYCLNWTGSDLQFWVDRTYVGSLSDKRLKTDIEEIDEDFLKIINEVEMKQFKVANRNGLISFGILAQDLMEIFEKYGKNPLDYEIVQETQYRQDDETIYYTINYEQFLILRQYAKEKEFEQQIEQLKNKIEEMEEKINDK